MESNRPGTSAVINKLNNGDKKSPGWGGGMLLEKCFHHAKALLLGACLFGGINHPHGGEYQHDKGNQHYFSFHGEPPATY
jgi:hypothetical protein